jgi:hypothetical protein
MPPTPTISRRPLTLVALFGLPLVALAAWVGLATRPRESPAVAPPKRLPEPKKQGPPLISLGKVVRSGLVVELRAAHLDPSRLGAAGFREGDNVLVSLKVSDLATGAPQSNAHPAAWLVPGSPEGPTVEKACLTKVESLISGHLFNRATVDLNIYYVVTLHDDTVAVYDPLFGFGGTKLLAQVALGGRAGDWRASLDESRLFVGLPDRQQLAVVDTRTWDLTRRVDLGRKPGRIALQPDGQYLWVADLDEPSTRESSGLTVLDADRLEVVARIATGRGRHALAFSEDSRHAFVTNRDSGTVSILDTRTLRKVVDLATGPGPISVDFSSQAGWAYVAHEGDGRVVAVDGRVGNIAGGLGLAPGLGMLRFAPGGRYGFVVNPKNRDLSIFEAATHRVIHRMRSKSTPDRLAFSDEIAYVIYSDSPIVGAIPLKKIGDEGRPVPIVEVPLGRNPLGPSEPDSATETVVPAPGGNAILVAHPSDRSIYYYKEGMSAPMGTFKVSSGLPRAVLALDRSLQESGNSGEYEAVIKLPEPGGFELAFVVNNPRVVHCFPWPVEPDPVLARARTEGKVECEWLGPDTDRDLVAGVAERITLRLHDAATGKPKEDLASVTLAAILAPGIWNGPVVATHEGGGVFAARFTPSRPGVYYLHLRDPQAQLMGPDRPLRILHAGPAKSP